jgi:hypothetical protein
MNPFLIVFIGSLSVLLALSVALSLRYDELFFKYYRGAPVCPVWDTKVHNWLVEDDLQIRFIIEDGVVYCIDTPIGPIWVQNYPYYFGQDHTNRATPSMITDDTMEKLKLRLEKEGLQVTRDGFLLTCTTELLHYAHKNL